MTTLCRADFVQRDCMCLADPMNDRSTVCGYINRQNGLVYPCDAGCCNPTCQGTFQRSKMNIEVRQSNGADLPPGFGTNLIQSNLGTEIPGASGYELPSTSNRKVWEVVGIVLGVMIFILLMAFYLENKP
jgi:hypothetical protein